MGDKKRWTKEREEINKMEANNEDGVVGGKDAQRIRSDGHDAQENGDDVGLQANSDDDTRISPSAFRAHEQNHFHAQPTQDGQGGQYSFPTNYAQTYYPPIGNINTSAPYWTHYYPGYDLYPTQAGLFLSNFSSYFAPQPTHPNDFTFFTRSYAPLQPQKPLPKSTCSRTLTVETALTVPEPAQDYILNASLPPYTLNAPTRHLLILDLNGTLLYRPRNPARERHSNMQEASKNPILRPYLADFMTYIFEHFDVMFWSSAKPHNVKAMIKATTTPEQRQKVLATWDRDRFGLTKAEYNAKSITIKDLNLVWGNRKMGGKKGRYGAGNTVLLDDSVIKAAYQPYNHICVPEFLGMGAWEGDVALREVAGYLEMLRYQGDIARFIKQRPFRLGDGWVSPLDAEKLVA
jgi:NLI interacting factor-like phosphatase